MIKVRSATSADLPAIQRITAASATAPQWALAQFAESIAPPASDAMRRAVLVAEAQAPEETIGFAVVSALVSIYPIEAELESIAVDPDHRGQGAGAALLQAAMEWLAALQTSGQPSVTFRLEVRVSNLPALHLYRRLGFAVVATRPGYYANPPEDALCMEIDIVPAMAPTSGVVMHP